MNRFSISFGYSVSTMWRFSVGLLCGLAGAALAFAYPRVFPTGGHVVRSRSRVQQLRVFWHPRGQRGPVLPDRHEWERGASLDPGRFSTGAFGSRFDWRRPGASARAVIGVRSSTGRSGAKQGASFRNKTIGELDWEGRTISQWGSQAPGGAARQHHDLHRLPNGDTLALVNIIHPVSGFTLPIMTDDAIYQVNARGEIVWRWVASEHLEEFGFTPQELQLVRESRNRDYLHLNAMTPLGPNKWFTQGDQRFDPQNILISSRNANFVVIIDKKTSHIVWRLGPDYPARSRQKLPRPSIRSWGSTTRTSSLQDCRAKATCCCSITKAKEISARGNADHDRLPGSGDRSPQEGDRLGVYGTGVGPRTLDLLQLLHQQRRAASERQHVHR